MEYVQRSKQWFCNSCWQNRVSQSYPYHGGPRPGDDEKVKKAFIAIAIVVVILIVIGVVSLVMIDRTIDNVMDINEEAPLIPTIRITLIDDDPDTIVVTHIAGERLNWSDFEMVIESKDDPPKTVTLSNLKGEMTEGDKITFTVENTPEMAGLDLDNELLYIIQIYYVEKNIIVWENKNTICEES